MTVSVVIPPHAVDRPQLRALLDVGIDAPLTVLVAPAGSGKTVLLAQWVASLRDARTTWVELSAADDDAVHFARRLIGSLAAHDPAFRSIDSALATTGGGLGAPLLEALVAGFESASGTTVVILDDLHRISNAEIVADLWRLVDMLPPHAHFVFSSRVDLRLGWSRHRLRHGLVELRAAQLAFDEHAAGRLLERIARRPIDAAVASAVVDRTQGWAAGVQLAGLRLRVHPTPNDIVAALDESDRLAIEYLSEEVLEAQSPDRRRALMELSVLEEMSAGLIESVAGISDGAGFLRELETESLFVVPVPGSEGRYRFHPLFRDLLRLRLRAEDRTAHARLLVAASEWHRAHGAIGEAVECLLAAESWAEAIDLVLSRGREVYERGETATVARWLSAVPRHILERRDDALVCLAMLEGMTGRATICEELMRAIIDRPETPVGVELIARAYTAALVQLRPHADRYLRDGIAMLERADAAGAVAIPDVMQITSLPVLRMVATTSIGRAHLFLGDLAQAESWLSAALETAGAGYGPYRVHAQGSLAICLALTGRLTAAAELADEALETARELSLLAHPAPADAYIARALISIQQSHPEAGAFALHEGYVRAAANARTQLMWIAHAASRLIDPTGTDAAAVAPDGPPPPLVRDVLHGLDNRRRREAGTVVPPSRTTTWSFRTFEDTAGLLAAGDAAGARARLAPLIGSNRRSLVQTVEAGLLGAWLASIEGRRADAKDLLESALDHASSEGLAYPFVRAGAPVMALIEALPGGPSRFGDEVLARFHALRAPEFVLAEPLTARELELLAYLPSRLTNAELAARCFVSVNTVKTHVAHIYRKLGVGGRDAAIARARELGLLTDVEIARMG